MNEKYISEVLDYERDIKPYKLIQIHSGVGSGKNTFIESFIKGDKQPQIPQKTVLLITSRRAKVDETISKVDIESKEALKKWNKIHRLISCNNKNYENDNQYKIISSANKKTKYVVEQKSVACTNAFIEYYFKHIYSPSDASTHLWELFDMIVIDEAHSLVTDATYQSSPFYTYELINHYLKLCNSSTVPINCKHLILMTGTPQPIDKIEFFKIPEHLIIKHNLFDICRNIQPQNIFFTEKNNIKYIIKNIINSKEKMIYFSNHILMPKKIRDTLLVGDCTFAVSFSDKAKRNSLDEFDKVIMENTENSLKETGLLPENVQLFFTTSRNKEGINIENKDIKFMIIETHNQIDIVQMAGRVRNGIKYVFIINDSEGYEDTEYEKLAFFTKSKISNFDKHYLGVANEFYSQLCSENGFSHLYGNSTSNITLHSTMKKGISDLKKYINYIHTTFPYVKYSYIDNAFAFYALKEIGKNINDCYNEKFSETPEIWKGIFPHTKIKSAKTSQARGNMCVEELLGGETVKVFTKEEAQLLKSNLISVLGLPNKSNLMSMIKNYTDYSCEAVGKKGKYRIFIK